MTSDEVAAALKLRYPSPEWASFFELRTGTGALADRSLDFWAMNCFPSKGFLTVAAEIKVSRGDFFKELADPKKVQKTRDAAMESYYVCPAGLIQPGEVPEGFGLLEVVANGTLRVKARAPQKAQALAFSPTFMASVLRRVTDAQWEAKQAKERAERAMSAQGDPEKFLTELTRKWHKEEWPKEQERMKKVLRGDMLHEARKEVLGKGGEELLAMMSKELGWFDGDIGEQVCQFVKMVEQGKARRVAGGDLVRTLHAAHQALGEVLQKAGSA
jgi:hypothetical protein